MVHQTVQTTFGLMAAPRVGTKVDKMVYRLVEAMAALKAALKAVMLDVNWAVQRAEMMAAQRVGMKAVQ